MRYNERVSSTCRSVPPWCRAPPRGGWRTLGTQNSAVVSSLERLAGGDVRALLTTMLASGKTGNDTGIKGHDSDTGIKGLATRASKGYQSDRDSALSPRPPQASAPSSRSARCSPSCPARGKEKENRAHSGRSGRAVKSNAAPSLTRSDRAAAVCAEETSMARSNQRQNTTPGGLYSSAWHSHRGIRPLPVAVVAAVLVNQRFLPRPPLPVNTTEGISQ